jgi:hypothetical protein
MFLKKFMLSSAAAALAVSSVFAANVPAGYSVYSYEDLKIGDRAGMNGGVIGCKSNVLVGFDAVVSTDIIAKGSVVLNDRASVEGAVTAGGAVVRGAGAIIKNGFAQYASVPDYTIPTKTFSTGSTIKTINNEASGSAEPGNYNKIEVLDRGTLTLSSGTYNCNSFKIGNDVKINFPTGPVIINVKNEFTFQDRSKMILPSGSDGSNIEIYYNGTIAVTIGFDSYAYGVFTAPNAAVTVADRAKFNGSLYAKKVELQPGLYATNLIDRWLTVDSDGDGVPDYVENVCGTNPNGSGNKPAKVVSGTYANKTSLGAQTVRMSVSHVSGYSHVADFPISFGKGSVKGDLIPVNNIVATNDFRAPAVPLPLESGYKLNGNKYHSITGEVNTGKKILYAFPISDDGMGLTKDYFQLSHFNENTDAWENVEIAYVTANAVYAYVSSFSVYAISDFGDNILRVTKETGAPAGSFTSITAAAAEVANRRALPTPDEKRYIIFVAAPSPTAPTVYDNEKIILPRNTSIIGGFSTLAGNYADLNDPVVTTPKKNRTVVTGIAGDPILETSSVIGELNVIIDGLEFRNSTCNYGAVRLRSGSGHASSIHVLNCVFANNSGSSYGALYLYNISKTHIESSVFYANKCTGAGDGNGSASAISIYQVSNCGVASKIHSCVFANNESNATFGPAGTICNVGDVYLPSNPLVARADRPVHIFDCTFYMNTHSSTWGASVACRENASMPMSVTNCIVYDAYKDDATQIISNGTTEFSTTGTEFFSSSGTIDPFANKADPDGADNVWGTSDDGLRLKIKSVYERTVSGVVPTEAELLLANTKFSFRDVAGRVRKTGPIKTGNINNQDKGAYESYLKVLTIGGKNTIGDVNGWNYQSKLKTVARSKGYLIDFVGTGSGYSAYHKDCLAEMGEDPSSPNPVIWVSGNNTKVVGSYDIQMDAADNTATVGGTIADYNTPTKLTDFVNTEFDFALLNLGDKEIVKLIDASTDPDVVPSVTTIVDGYIAFANALAAKTNLGAGKVILSSLVNVPLEGTFQTAVSNYNNDILSKASTLVGAKYSLTVGTETYTGNMNQNVSFSSTIDVAATDHQVAEGVESFNYVSLPHGFEAMANIWWNMINATLGSM